ncbi:hypothetical protein JCM5350_008004 [Sporobolomyces pararoseus]
MVNRRLRDMSEKYLFSTLRFSKSEDPIFLYSILPSTKANCITAINFDIGPKTTPDSLVSFILRIPHLLPNLSSIVNLGRTFIANLPVESLSAVEPVFERGLRIAEVLKNRQIRSALQSMASRITRWDAAISCKPLEILLERNIDHITSLSFCAACPEDSLEREDSQLPALLSRLASLRSLSITHKSFDDSITPLHDSVLTHSYPFSLTLRSLVLDLETSSISTVPNEFKFAALFPQLEYLRIVFRSDCLEHIRVLGSKAFTFPNLLRADFVNCPFDDLFNLPRILHLPSIQDLQILYDYNYDDENEEEDPLQSLVACFKYISLLPFTLRRLRFNAPICHRGLQEICDGFTTILYQSNEQRASAEEEAPGRNDPDLGTSSSLVESVDKEEVEKEKEKKEKVVEKRESHVVRSARDLARWLTERVETVVIGKDHAGARELFGLLEGVKNLKNWIED